MNPNGLTVLVGFHPDLRIFAGFDLAKHKEFTTGSPSIQIDINALHSALQNGLSFHTKSNDEIAIGIRPDQFLTYCLNSEFLHKYGAEKKIKNLLSKAVKLEEINEQDISRLTIGRKKIVEKISRYSRDANFRQLVLNAYERRCAVTRMQLHLIDAAHVLPAADENSSDNIVNGIALSPTYHRAYDNCLIYLDEDYYMRINEDKLEELRVSNSTGGVDSFRSHLDKRIHLPFDVNQRPSLEYIRLANKHRRIPGYI
jgi:putative restriction endonuclease